VAGTSSALRRRRPALRCDNLIRDLTTLVNIAFLQLSVKKPGRLQLRIYDLCITNSELNVPVKVADIERIHIHGPNLVREDDHGILETFAVSGGIE
jgi:hypothetical protein